MRGNGNSRGHEAVEVPGWGEEGVSPGLHFEDVGVLVDETVRLREVLLGFEATGEL